MKRLVSETSQGGGGRGYIPAATGHFHSVQHLHRNELYPLIQTVYVMHGLVDRYDLGKITISNSAFSPLHESQVTRQN